MTRMTGPDCVVMCNLINTHTHTITTKKDAVSRCRNFENYVPYGLLQFNDITTLCSTGSQQGVDVTDTVEAVVKYVGGLLASRRVFCWLPYAFFCSW